MSHGVDFPLCVVFSVAQTRRISSSRAMTSSSQSKVSSPEESVKTAAQSETKVTKSDGLRSCCQSLSETLRLPLGGRQQQSHTHSTMSNYDSNTWYKLNLTDVTVMSAFTKNDATVSHQTSVHPLKAGDQSRAAFRGPRISIIESRMEWPDYSPDCSGQSGCFGQLFLNFVT